MNTPVNASPTTDAQVILSDRAAARIATILKSEAPGTMFRVSVEGGGCSGFQYKFGFDMAVNEDDIVLEKANARVLIDTVSLPYMAGAQIDFVEELLGQSFKINNPNAVASCGCGVSFTV
jgi:iron-sulfur cluster assembly accessory protein